MKTSRCLVAAIFCLATNFAVSDRLPENELLVLLKEGAGKLELSRSLQTGEYHILKELDIGERSLLVLKPLDDRLANILRAHPLVDSVEPNAKVSLVRPVSNEPVDLIEAMGSKRKELTGAENCVEQPVVSVTGTWGLIRTSYIDKPSYTSDNYLYQSSGKGVDIYVLDSGIDIDHADLLGRSSQAFVAASMSDEGHADFNGHGTNVASLAGGTVYGVAKDANLISVKVLDRSGSGSYADIIEGINYVTDKVKADRSGGKKVRAIINLSLGGEVSSKFLYNSIGDAVKQGIVVIAAAGNEQDDTSSHYPASYDNVITVGASDSLDTMADFSNYGVAVDICAPGVAVHAAWSSDTIVCAIAGNDCIRSISGTSQATPHVAGVVARYLEELSDSQLDNVYIDGLKDMLIETSSKDYINYQYLFQRSTPNRLLYKTCGKTGFELPEPCSKCLSSATLPRQCSVLLFITLALLFSML